MNTRPPLLFALHGTQEYAARVARHMALELAELEDAPSKTASTRPAP